MNAILNVSNLTKLYKDGSGIKNLNFTIHDGEIFVILGKNGSGKTTTLKLLLGMIEPDAGEITFQNKNIKKLGNSLYHSFSAVLESVDNTYSYLTAKENIEYFCSLYKKKITKEEIDNLLEKFQLLSSKNKKAGDFSRGMRQKLSIICSLLNDSQVLFLDEPTLGLDFSANKELLLLIKEMATAQKKTIILTSHQADVLDYLAQTVLLIDQGTTSYYGSYEKFLASYHSELYELHLSSLPAGFDYTNFTVKQDKEKYILTHTSQREMEKLMSYSLTTGEKILFFAKKKASIDEILTKVYEVNT